MAHVLMIGGHGFLGRAVAVHLAGTGHVVHPAPPVERLDLVEAGARRVSVMIDWIRERGDGEPVAVVNCAGAVGGTEDVLERANVELPTTLARACADDVPLVHLGSAAEYGPIDPGTAVREHARARPAHAYGRTKLAGTRAVLENAPGAVVLRVFNPVGAGQPATTLPGSLAAATQREPYGAVISTGPLDAVRDFVASRDVARAVGLALATPDAAGRILNVAGGRPVTTRDLAELIVARAGRGQVLAEDGAGTSRSAAVDWSLGDVTAARDLLGWEPASSLEDAVGDLLSGHVAVAATAGGAR